MAQIENQKQNFAQTLNNWIDLQVWRFSKNWFLIVNLFFGVLAGFPLLAPILMHYGFTNLSNMIYQAYRITCHQLPSRSYFIFGHQVAVCHRDLAIWTTIFLGGVLYALLKKRMEALPFQWWILFVIPIGLDGGTQLVGGFYEILPWYIPTGFALSISMGLTLILRSYNQLRWQYLLFIWCFPLGMFFVQMTGPRLSNWVLRSITGTIFGIGNVLLIFPILEEEFDRIQHNLRDRLSPVLD